MAAVAAGAGAAGPLEGMIGAAGLGMSAYGMISGMQEANKESGLEAQFGQEEQQMLGVQRQQMTLDYNRQQRQLVRNSLQSRANARSASVASGSQRGSGLGGGEGQIGGQTGTYSQNLLGNYQLGLQANTIASQEAQTAQQIGQTNTQMSEDQAIEGIGSSVTNNAQGLSSLAQLGGSFLGAFIGA